LTNDGNICGIDATPGVHAHFELDEITGSSFCSLTRETSIASACLYAEMASLRKRGPCLSLRYRYIVAVNQASSVYIVAEVGAVRRLARVSLHRRDIISVD
jgi:hypothetical protein